MIIMSNSPLISYTKISPNSYGRRTHKIDTITIHCVVGQLSAESICECFTDTWNGSSCNYGIGNDGRIALVLGEDYASCCSSSQSNDQRAITIECASDATHPYAINSAVYNSLVKLCADICKRNDIKELKWKGDKSLIGQVDKQNMTVHRWFANKACPGDYIYNRLGQIASEVNAILNGSKNQTVIDDAIITANSSTIWKFLKNKGLNNYAVAGIMGNLYAESALNPKNLQNSYERKLGYSNDSYTKAVDDGSYVNFVKDSAGYGLAQWTYYTRKQNLLKYAKSKGRSIGDLNIQLEFMWTEIQSSESIMNILKKATSISQASDIILTEYERPADQSTAVRLKRAQYGQTYYDKYASKQTVPTKRTYPKPPFTVQVSVSDLNYRSKPSKDGIVKGQTGKGIFTIVEVSNDWGKLKSGAGWIYLGGSDNCIINTTSRNESKNTSFKVRVDIANLNIRKGAGTDYSTIGKYTGKGIFTIVETKSGKGSNSGWGKLKSGLGWISLDYAEKV